MKKLILVLSILFALYAWTGCSDDDITTPELTTDEYPRIFGRWPEGATDGTLGEFDIPLDQVLNINVQYTPADLCEGIWYLDGREIHRGVGLTFVPSVVGEFNLKLVVKTPTKETSREAILVVSEPTE
ncbi:MAG: hypothetical protein WCS34_06590 [Bacteroidales bacterium]